MKQDIYIKTTKKGQIEQGIADVPFGLFNSSLTFSELHMERDSQHLGRDGPPGRARSPGFNPRRELHLIAYL